MNLLTDKYPKPKNLELKAGQVITLDDLKKWRLKEFQQMKITLKEN